MIKAEVRHSRGGFVEFSVSGHAGYADPGFDVVCAAVSAIVQTAVLGIEATKGITSATERVLGRLVCRVTSVESERSGVEVNAIVRAMALGLQSVEAKHGKYIRLQIVDPEEVSTCS